jgi:glycosyltransferase involved in cell wall biosynthesis
MTPKVSIIIPVYNTEAYLERALTSVLSQTYRDFEAICVNDGSTDNSLAILESYAQKDSRIKIISQDNQGLSMARNNGLKEAQGEYVYFFDSDDALHPQMLEITVSKIIEYLCIIRTLTKIPMPDIINPLH